MLTDRLISWTDYRYLQLYRLLTTTVTIQCNWVNISSLLSWRNNHGQYYCKVKSIAVLKV